MALKITHPDTLTPTNKLNDILYGHHHTITGDVDEDLLSSDILTKLSNIETLLTSLSGKTFKLPVIIENKTLPTGSTSFEFTNLNGNNDGIYLLYYHIYMESDANYNIKIIPNSTITTDQKSTITFYTNSYWNYRNNYLMLLNAIDNLKLWHTGQIIIFPKTGMWREYYGHGYYGRDNEAFNGPTQVGGYWKDTTTNITSLKFQSSTSNTFKGEVKLCKMVDLSL